MISTRHRFINQAAYRENKVQVSANKFKLFQRIKIEISFKLFFSGSTKTEEGEWVIESTKKVLKMCFSNVSFEVDKQLWKTEKSFFVIE